MSCSSIFSYHTSRRAASLASHARNRHGLAPNSICEPLSEKACSRYSLRSADDKHLLAIPKTKSKTLGDRAFYHAAPTVWNSVPLEIRLSPSIQVFKNRLKTFLFKKAFH